MRLSLLCTALLVACLLTASLHPQAPPLVAPTPPRTPDEERKGFHLPPGFEAQLVAAEPEIHKPLNLAFDERGRLWVTDTVEYPFPASEGQKPRDTLKVLEDFGPDGRARKITTFADGLNIPIGVLPLPGARGAIVHSIPAIWRVEDTDGDGKADKREPLFEKFGSADTHGMTNSFTRSFDGWVYATHGFANNSTVRGQDGQAVTMNSGNTYRMRLDGSHVEQYTWGQVNPFGMAVDPLGNLFTADCHSRPIYQLLRGAWYPSFAKPHDGLGFGPEMMTHSHNSTGIAGIAYYAAEQYPPAFRDNLFIGNVVTSRINRDRLDRRGSTLRAVEEPDLVVSDDLWFRPVDLKLGPDGALYVADFYNRIIGHYEVPLTHPGRDRERGRIWRIVYRGPDAAPSPPVVDSGRSSVPELIADLNHPNLAVRLEATHQLSDRGGDEALAALRPLAAGQGKPWQRAHALWVLARRGALDEATIVATARDPEPLVRVHAMRVLSERTPWSSAERELAVAALKDSDGFVQRAAVDALARHPSPATMQPLLDLREAVAPADTHLAHTVRMAVRDHLREASAWQQLPNPLSAADERAVADVATGVPSTEAARFLLQHIRRTSETSGNLVRQVQHIARRGTRETDAELMAWLHATPPSDVGVQAQLLRAFAQGVQERGASLSEETRASAADVMRKLLASSNESHVQAGAELAALVRVPALQQELAALAGTSRGSVAARGAALNALVALDSTAHVALLDRILGDPAEPGQLREQVATLLGRINQLEVLAKALPTAPAPLQRAIALALVSTRPGAEKLLEAIAAGKASARLLQERALDTRLTEARIPDLKARLAELTRGLPTVDQRVQQLLGQRRDAFQRTRSDAALGLAVFEKHCAACHQIAGKGNKIGPQLDGIGNRGLERLLEDLLDPSRNVDQAFRQTTLNLKNGQVVHGLLLREEGAVLVLADAQGKEVRVAKDTVEEKSVTPLSPMPGNVAELVTEAELNHLLAYLLAQRGK